MRRLTYRGCHDYRFEPSDLNPVQRQKELGNTFTIPPPPRTDRRDLNSRNIVLSSCSSELSTEFPLCAFIFTRTLSRGERTYELTNRRTNSPKVCAVHDTPKSSNGPPPRQAGNTEHHLTQTMLLLVHTLKSVLIISEVTRIT